jgi:hypothetical protein
MKFNVDPNAKFIRNSLFCFGDDLFWPRDRPPNWHFLQKWLKFWKSLLRYNKSLRFYVFLPVGSRTSKNGLRHGWENKLVQPESRWFSPYFVNNRLKSVKLYFLINMCKNTADNIKKQMIFWRKYTFMGPSTNRLANRDAVFDMVTSLRDGRSRNRCSIPGRRITFFSSPKQPNWP